MNTETYFPPNGIVRLNAPLDFVALRWEKKAKDTWLITVELASQEWSISIHGLLAFSRTQLTRGLHAVWRAHGLVTLVNLAANDDCERLFEEKIKELYPEHAGTSGS